MKTVMMTRREATQFYEHCTRCGRPPRSAGEDRDEVQKFKYAVGRNYQIAARVHDETERLKIAQITDPPEMPEPIKAYERERRDILMRHSKRNEGGQVVLRRDEQTGETNPVIPPDAHGVVIDAINDLQARYAEPIQEWNQILADREAAIAAAQNAIEDELVSFEIYTYPFARVPESISGTHLADLSIMLSNAPDLEDMLDASGKNRLQKTPQHDGQ